MKALSACAMLAGSVEAVLPLLSEPDVDEVAEVLEVAGVAAVDEPESDGSVMPTDCSAEAIASMKPPPSGLFGGAPAVPPLLPSLPLVRLFRRSKGLVWVTENAELTELIDMRLS
jgi:hypothetical protein